MASAKSHTGHQCRSCRRSNRSGNQQQPFPHSLLHISHLRTITTHSAHNHVTSVTRTSRESTHNVVSSASSSTVACSRSTMKRPRSPGFSEVGRLEDCLSCSPCPNEGGAKRMTSQWIQAAKCVYVCTRAQYVEGVVQQSAANCLCSHCNEGKIAHSTGMSRCRRV